MKAVDTKIGAIKPYWRNPRVHTQEKIGELKKSIEQFGFNVPLVLDKEAVIITGHARYRAALELEMETIPCVTVDLDPQRAKEFRIADNKIHDLSSWLYEELRLEVGDAVTLRSIAGFGQGDEDAMFPTDTGNEFDFTGGDTIEGGEGTPQGAPDNGDDPQTSEDTGETTEEDEDNLVVLTCPHCFTDSEYDLEELLAIEPEPEALENISNGETE